MLGVCHLSSANAHFASVLTALEVEHSSLKVRRIQQANPEEKIAAHSSLCFIRHISTSYLEIIDYVPPQEN